MEKSTITQIHKRDGSIVAFDADKIQQAIYKALSATGKDDLPLAGTLASEVVGVLEKRSSKTIPAVEGVQDIVEEVLLSSRFSC